MNATPEIVARRYTAEFAEDLNHTRQSLIQSGVPCSEIVERADGWTFTFRVFEDSRLGVPA